VVGGVDKTGLWDPDPVISLTFWPIVPDPDPLPIRIRPFYLKICITFLQFLPWSAPVRLWLHIYFLRKTYKWLKKSRSTFGVDRDPESKFKSFRICRINQQTTCIVLGFSKNPFKNIFQLTPIRIKFLTILSYVFSQ